MKDTKHLNINLDQAIPMFLPSGASCLEPQEFQTADGRAGWVVDIPGRRPIATPAYSDGRLFVGGGYGSHEFYAFDAATGALAWQIHTGDDGPTAAVIEDGCVAFNTESCTVFVCDARDGRILWQEWLGDPLMSQPAIENGKLFIAYPASRGPARGHRLLCADLRIGRHIWERDITADVITAPVISDGKVHLSCLDGMSYVFDAEDGTVIRSERDAGTSAPIVVEGREYKTRKRTGRRRVYEGLLHKAADGGPRNHEDLCELHADYLRPEKEGGVGIGKDHLKSLDSSVGFAHAPLSAKLDMAREHIGVSTVAGAWAYQGSRAAWKKGRVMNAQGAFVNSIGRESGKNSWRARAAGRGVSEDDQVFCPPALGEDYMYLCSTAGHMLSVRQEDGDPGFMYATRQPMAFQPALAEGSMYAGTNNGRLLCLVTGSADAHGWHMWGGNAQHNKND